MGQVLREFELVEAGSFGLTKDRANEPTNEPQMNLEKWVSAQTVADGAQVSYRAVAKALEARRWRGCDLLVREEITGRGRGGKTLLVHVDSLPADLREAWYEAWYLERGIVLHEKPDTDTGKTVLVPEQPIRMTRALRPIWPWRGGGKR